MNNNPICFFDSGIGGSTILKEVIKNLPNENYVYYPDSLNNPYGNKSKEELFLIVDNVVKKLIPYNPKMIVCACNTATSMVLNDIRDKYKDIIFIGTEPAVKVVFDKYKDKKSIILTTRGTYESDRFRSLCDKYSFVNTKLVPLDNLASLIETNKDAYDYLYDNLKDFTDTEVVVLGCTHFPLVKNEIRNILGDVIFIDGGPGISKRIIYFLDKNNNYNLNKSKSGELIILGDKDIDRRIRNIVYSDL